MPNIGTNVGMPTRRMFGKMAGSVALAASIGGWPEISLAANPTGVALHGLSPFGELKYPSDYKHFAFVNPDAPKGGRMVFQPPYWFFNQNSQSFNSLNTFVLKNDAPPRMEMCFDALMTSVLQMGALDDAGAIYCQLAESVTISEDRNSYTFQLRPEARFHDGSPVTAPDVAFSVLLLKEKGHPELALDLRNLDDAVAIDERSVVLKFNGKQSDRSILSVSGYPIFSRAYYSTVEFDDRAAVAPLSSGPYRVGKFKEGTFIEYERVEDYWGKDMPFAVGFNNFDVIRVEFYRERVAGFEAFKKGAITYREEFTSKTWALGYDFPAVSEGKVIKREFDADARPSFQGWALNQRREKFADARVRQAVGLCFDFEWTNKNLFYGAYQRAASFFEKSDFKAIDAPTPEELALLEPLRGTSPDAIFDTATVPNVTDGSGNNRKALRQALKLLNDAGWSRKGGKVVNAAGEPLSIEILIRAQVFERILGRYVQNLNSIGITAEIRLVDSAQFQQRLDEFDFDMVGLAFGLGTNPTGESMKQFFGSETAQQQGSRNYAGIEDPGVDAMIKAVSAAKTRKELEIALRSLDRVLRAGHYWIPNWYSANHRVAYWDMFGFQEPKPEFAFPVEQFWWFDTQKAKILGKA